MDSDRFAVPGIDKWRGRTDMHPLGRRSGPLFLSGPIEGINPEDGRIAEDVATQLDQALANMRLLSERAQIGLDNVAQVRAWLSDARHREAFRAAWAASFPDPSAGPALVELVHPRVDGRAAVLDMVAVAGVGRVPVGGGGEADPPGAVVVGDYFFSSSISGLELEMGDLPDKAEQVARAHAAMAELVASAGFELQDVAHMFLWQASPDVRPLADPHWAEIFPDVDCRPARHGVLTGFPGPECGQIDIAAVRTPEQRTLPALPGLAHAAGREVGFLPVATSRGKVLFSSASVGYDPETSEMPEDLDRQAEFLFAHKEAMLEACGYSMADIAHAYVWHRAGADMGAFDRVWRECLTDHGHFPARHDVAGVLPANPAACQFQLEIIAVRD